MAGNNCDDAFQQIQELQERNRQLRDEMNAMERQMKAAGVYAIPAQGESVILPGRRGPVELNTGDIQTGYKQLAGTLTSKEVIEMVNRGLVERAKPNGSEGRFQNYDRMLREVDVSRIDDYARLAEALGITHARMAPDDFALLTESYDNKRLGDLISNYYRTLGISDPDLLSRAATVTMPMLNAVENKVWLRFWADRSKRLYLDALENMRDHMRALPGAPVPAELKAEAFRQYKLALALERHNNLVTRRHAQALRSQQQILGLDQMRLDLGDEQELAAAIEMRPRDLDKDEHFGRVIQAIDDNGAKGEEQLSLLIDAAEADQLDPKGQLDKDWFNTHMRMANALIKDSQLGNVNTQWLNIGSNGVMGIFGPVQETMYNGARLTPFATQLTRQPLMEAVKISAEAHNFAWSTMKATWKRDLNRVFQEGISHYSGNLDTYGKRLLTNEQEIADLQAIIDMPYKQGANKFASFLHPHNAALFTNKLQVAARILVFTKPNGAREMSRAEAAWSALGLDMGQGVQRVDIRGIDTWAPWKPALRAMAGVDDIFGKYHYLFKLKADLEVKARMEGAQLGLFDDRDRAEWVQRQIDEAIYQATPSEANIKAFRKEHGLKGSDFTDDEIGAMLAERNLAGAPTLATQESIDALQHSAEMRFQAPPEEGFPALMDRAVMTARQNWMVDRFVMPYWRSPLAGVLLDNRLATFGMLDTIKMLGVKDPDPKLVARVKAGWTMSGALLLAFGVLDAAGQVRGGTDPDPAKRNTLFGVRLGGFPVLNTLFLWKDLGEALSNSLGNKYDQQELGLAWMKVMTNHITRQAGIQQVQMLLDYMLDGSKRAGEKLRQAAGFMGAGQMPFIGAERNLERLIGADRSSFLRDAPDTAAQQYLLNKDDPFAKVEQFLKELAYDTLPITAMATGNKRKETDHLGSPIGHVFGINLSRAIPFIPSVWPSGRINDVVYAELDSQDMLDPPRPLLTRTLEGVAMSDELQREYNDIHGTIKADPSLPPSARMSLAGKSVQVQFNMPVEVVTQLGVRIRKDNTASLPLSPILDKLTAGKTKKEALYALFTSPWYQAMEDDKRLSATPPGGLPGYERRKRTAQVLIRGITDYYDLLTQDELERRAASGKSQPAKEWSDMKTEMAREIFRRSEEGLPAAAGALRDALMPAE